MTRTAFIIILILALSCQAGKAQVLITDGHKVPRHSTHAFRPDTEGKVVVAGEWMALKAELVRDDTLTLFPGWPLSLPGENERGGIFCNLDADDSFEIVYTVGLYIYAYNDDGSLVPGWPVLMDFPADGAPAFGDIDGDTVGEVIVTTHKPGSVDKGSIYALRGDGTMLPAFPVVLQGGAIKTPVLADINNDGALEIVITVREWPNGFVYVFRSDGSVYPGWPIRMDYTPGSAAAVGDIDADGVPEILAQSYYSLNVYDTYGTMVPGFPFTPGDERVFSYSTPVLADLDGDSHREIIFGDHSLNLGDGRVYVMRSDGTHLPGWPKVTGYWIYGPPSVGDINGDGVLDIAIGDQLLSPTPQNKVYAWDSQTGEELPGFPITGLNAVNNQIILADLDGDDAVELVFDDNTSANVYPGYNHDGTPMEGWPLAVSGTTFFINPFAADINRDGETDLSGGGHIAGDDITNLYLWETGSDLNPDLLPLPVLQYNTRHNGVFGDYLMVGTLEESNKDYPVNILRIWPNPASDRVGISLPHEGRYTIDLLDPAGRPIFSTIRETDGTNGLRIDLDIHQLETGLYVISVSEANRIMSGKLLVR
jgi:hypothetical protein